MMPPFPPERERKIKAAMAFLEVELLAGPRPAQELIDKARARGIALGTLGHARKRAFIHSERKGNQWVWSTAAQRQERKVPTS